MHPRTLCSLAFAATLLAACSSNERAASTGTGAGGRCRHGRRAGHSAGQITPGSEEDLVRNVGDRIFFDTDRSDLSDTACNTLMRQVQWPQQHPTVNVLISGNCDERGTEEYNLGFGQRRAVAEANLLVAQGVSASRLQTISYGKDRPVDPTNTPEAWAKNRNTITQVR
jgi:peptidoglycan-associated lipoprotein